MKNIKTNIEGGGKNENAGRDCCAHVNPAERGRAAAAGGAPDNFYTCPMHPEIKQNKPGMCPECGMALIKLKIARPPKLPGRGRESLKFKDGADTHAGHHGDDLLKKFWVSVVLTAPILAYSELPVMLFGRQAPSFAGAPYLLLVLGSIVFLYCGRIFLAGAYRELQARLPGMMTLIALAVTTAYVWSVYETFAAAKGTLWAELTTLIAVMLLGHWIEMRSVKSARSALRELSKLLPDEAERLKPDAPGTEIVPLARLKVGDILLVRPGAKVPADGKIIEGASAINESILTGESKPVEKSAGAAVIAGSINGDGGLKVEVTKIGERTFLAGVMRLIAEAETSKSRLQMLSDRAALWLTLIAIVAGGITAATWLAAGAGASVAIERLVAVLVITCPHALGLAIPLVSSIGTTMGAQNGLLIRRRFALESARGIDAALFDKTGTLTEGKFTVVQIKSANYSGDSEAEENKVLMLAAAVDARSEHPIAKAIVAEARRRSLPLAEVKDFRRVPGRGAEASIGGRQVFVGAKGGDDIVVESNGQIAGTITVADSPRPESKIAVAGLKKLGIKVVMITGDSEKTAKKVADSIGVDEYFARVLPEDKISKVKELQERGLKVAMIGDGINDAPAMAQADVGIAVGAGTNVAVESSGIVLVKSDPRDIVKIIRLSKLTYAKMIQNLWWATGYNVAAIPLAAGALAAWGVYLPPSAAAFAMSLSTIVVSVNAILMRRKKL